MQMQHVIDARLALLKNDIFIRAKYTKRIDTQKVTRYKFHLSFFNKFQGIKRNDNFLQI